jgi:hypothetical protein
MAAAFLTMGFVLATALACVLMKNVNRRWLWLPFTLIGFITFRMDTMGMWTLQLISFQLFAGSFTWSGSAFEPWIFGVSIPVGAILFWTPIRARPSSETAEVF